MDLEDYQQIKTSVQKLLDINLDNYKDEQMRRRLDAWLGRSGIKTWTDYLIKLRSDQEELQRFRNYLTINVTEFFRDPERWQFLRQSVVQELLRASVSIRPVGVGLRVWSAGCSTGAEPFSLVMLLDEVAPSRRHYILATDLDRGAMARAQSGGPFLTEEVKNLSLSQKALHFNPGGPPYFVNSTLIRRVTFKEQNMISDSFEEDFDLIVCRNVVIYFTTETKDSLYQKFHNALRPGGFMFVGGTEIISRPHEIGFKNYGVSFYLKMNDNTAK